MSARKGEVGVSGDGGLFRRLILPLVVLTMGAGLFAQTAARRAEEERLRERLLGIAESNARLCEKLNLSRTARLARDLSTTTGATIVFSGPERELISAVPLAEWQRELCWEAMRTPGTICRREGYQAVASALSEDPSENLLVLHEGPPAAFFQKKTLTPSLLGGLLLGFGAALFVSRSVVTPLRKMARETRTTPDDEPLSLPSNLLARRDEIGRLAHELVDHRRRLLSEQDKRRRAERLALLGEITTSLAHEIKNPAASIIMQGKQLESRGEIETGQLIREEGERIASLVDQWLYVAKPEGVQTKEHDLVALVRDVLTKMKPVMDYHRVEVQVNGPGKLSVPCDARRMEHVVRNLLDNALQAMPDGGLLTLSFEDRGEQVVFSIRDEGEGLSEEALANFGEAFYSEREGGFGLGLTLVCGVMKAHHGEVRAANHPSGGALITVTLPKIQSPRPR